MVLPGLGKAVELPSGVYNVVSELKYLSPGLNWHVWGLEDGAGGSATLGMVDGEYVELTRQPCAAPPDAAAVEHEAQTLVRRHQGEAMATLSREGKHDFWLAKYRHYAGGGVQVIFTRDKDGDHRVVARAMSSARVRVYG